jgi:hypothetical protein
LDSEIDACRAAISYLASVSATRWLFSCLKSTYLAPSPTFRDLVAPKALKSGEVLHMTGLMIFWSAFFFPAIGMKKPT